MVLSTIDNNINYFETGSIDKNDLDYESYVYRGSIYGNDIKFVLGKPCFEYVDNNIVYFNMYLANRDKIVTKMGIYETENTMYRNILDEDGIVIIEKLNEPLIFPFSKPLIMNNYKLEDNILQEDSDEQDSSDEEDTSDEEDSDQEEEEKEPYSDDELEEVSKLNLAINEQTKEEAELEIANYKEQETDKWINKFLKSSKYSIIDNEGGGDCFFAVLRDALKSTGLEKYSNLSVKSIRERLSDEVDQKQYDTYKEFYGYYSGGLKKSQEDLSKYKKQHKTIKTMIGGTSNSSEKSELLDNARSNLKDISQSSDKQKEFNELVEEFDFMKDVKTIDDLKNVIKKSDYWADSWAISTLERLYNVKFIIFAKNNYDNGELENVLQCGEGDPKLLEKMIFEPEFYIIADYLVDIHYKLITYDKNIDKAAFKFKEIPYKIKQLILEKCMEKNAGLFVLIPEFKDFADANNLSIKPVEPKYDTLVDKTKSKLYDDSIVIQIYNKSVDKKVGEGSGETIEKELKTLPTVLELNKEKHWRRKLDNSWSKFSEDDNANKLDINGKEWSSVQQFMYASRFSNIPEIYNLFVKNSKHNASKSVEDAKNFHDSILKDKSLKGKLISEEEFKTQESNLLLIALKSKFSISEFKKILLLTGDSKINIFKPGRGGGATEAKELMAIRQLLAK